MTDDSTFRNLTLNRHANKLASEVTNEVINEKSTELGIESELKSKRKEKNDLLKKIKNGNANNKDMKHYFQLLEDIKQLNDQKKENCELEYNYKKDCQKVVKNIEETEKSLLGISKETVKEKTVSEINNLKSVRGVDSTKGV